ncbi:uncharacterized protein LOC127878010 isoform X2 [Dreissena polymorpha]|uniref:uncharacterized protein LOC127878010 isoform X2 n=1 Tax=Dreissena polymorpha TaxID=45954 RepID=UPI002264F417|nr:uncharacterized protein LOC127878010 isoform X2 [Dreissena polymorpha]
MSETIVIKHLSSGRFIHPSGGLSNPGDGTNLDRHSAIHDRMHWRFVPVVDHWGYIEHVASGKVVHPRGGSLTPGDHTDLVVDSARHWGALFALDCNNHHVIHKGGKFAHPKGGRPDAGDHTTINLHWEQHDAMKFGFFSPSNPNKEVLVYGYPKMFGKWKIIHMVLNPSAEHTFTLEVKVGMSKTESKTSGFEYSWESSGGVNIEILSLSASQSIKYMMEQTSSQTWSNETTTTSQINVVTWQWVFDVEQNENKSVFQSNLLADTGSETEVPRDLQYKVKTGQDMESLVKRLCVA